MMFSRLVIAQSDGCNYKTQETGKDKKAKNECEFHVYSPGLDDA